MEKYRVRLTSKALTDLDDIFRYIAYHNLAPLNAKKQTDRIYNELKSLEYFPHAHQIRNIGKFASENYRQLLVDNYMVIFKILEESQEVRIIRIIYQKRNL